MCVSVCALLYIALIWRIFRMWGLAHKLRQDTTPLSQSGIQYTHTHARTCTKESEISLVKNSSHRNWPQTFNVDRYNHLSYHCETAACERCECCIEYIFARTQTHLSKCCVYFHLAHVRRSTSLKWRIFFSIFHERRKKIYIMKCLYSFIVSVFLFLLLSSSLSSELRLATELRRLDMSRYLNGMCVCVHAYLRITFATEFQMVTISWYVNNMKELSTQRIA